MSLKRYSRLYLIAFAAVICMAILFVAQYVSVSRQYNDVYGFSEILRDHFPVIRPILLFAGTFLGILFSFALKRIFLERSESSLRDSLNMRSFFVACVLSPSVLAGIYTTVATLESVMLMFLIAYQNGFFWENVSSVLGSSSKPST